MNTKFRVFDVENNRYLDAKRCFIDGNGEFYYKCDDGQFYNWKYDFVIEWWTEKHDKHGKKIFEGDLCKGLVNTCTVVKTDKFRWGDYGIDIEQKDCDFVEIIGNIHGVKS